MAQPVTLRLSPAEWMLCVMTVQPDATSTLSETVNRTMTPERLQGALQAARDALLARDLARFAPDGKLDINPVVRLCARAVLTPNASFGLTLIEADGSSRVLFYNAVPGFAVGTWVDANQIRSFELIDSAKDIPERIVNLWGGDGAGSAPVRTFNMPAQSLPGLPVDKPAKVDGLAAALARGGLPADEAAALEKAFATPSRRAVLAAAGQGSPATHTLLWLGTASKLWLISQTIGAPDLSVSITNTAGLSRALATFANPFIAAVK